MGKFIDLTGMRFGRLAVINKTSKRDSSGCVYWHCKCDCGSEIETTSTLLRSGKSKSCGCLQKEIARRSGKKNKHFNNYDLSGEYGIGYTSSGEKFFFDIEDFDRLKDICWSITKNGYLLGWDNGKCFTMHRHVLGDKCDGTFVDHKNHNKLDNRKENLRLCTKSENGTNAYSEKGYRGVYWDKKRCVWLAEVYKKGKRIALGSFNNFDDALKARKTGEGKYYGDFRYIKNQDYRFNPNYMKDDVSFD